MEDQSNRKFLYVKTNFTLCKKENKFKLGKNNTQSLDFIILRTPRPGALGLLNFGLSDSFSGYSSSRRYFSLIISSLSISN